MMKLFLVLFLSHLLIDFVFQNDNVISEKMSNVKAERHFALFKHSMLFLFLALIINLLAHTEVDFWKYLGLIVLLTISHYTIDLVKISLSNEIDNFKLFIIDQFIHVTLIVIGILVISDVNITFINEIINNKLYLNLYSKLDLAEKAMFVISVLIMVTSLSNIMIRIFLKSIKKEIIDDNDNDNDKVKIGRYIGSLERILTLYAVLSSQYQALFVIYAVKTAIRFEQAKKDQEFAEYFILGTFISALSAITVGLLVKLII